MCARSVGTCTVGGRSGAARVYIRGMGGGAWLEGRRVGGVLERWMDFWSAEGGVSGRRGWLGFDSSIWRIWVALLYSGY